MNEIAGNIFNEVGVDLRGELFEEILTRKNLKIERIISHGHSSPKTGWYDQAQSEWLIILAGSGKILFEDGQEFLLSKGDYLNIPAHTKHKVLWTKPDEPTIWLAVHYS